MFSRGTKAAFRCGAPSGIRHDPTECGERQGRASASTSAVPRTVLLFHLAVATGVVPAAAAQVSHSARVEFFPLARVRLLEGPFAHAQELDRRYVLALEPDRLLAGFRIEAGLEPRAPKYPNWESSGLDGHIAGHYLTALAQLWASTGDPEMKRRLDYMVGELAECQRANDDGYVGAVPGGRALWADVAAGRFDAQGFSLKDAWVPWYNLHKTFAGLRDAWLLAHNEQARDVLVQLADWCGAVTGGLSDEKMQLMLRTEHGGMNEVLADVFAITGDPKYLELAERFSHRAILDPLLQHEDRLTGLHANTQIPKVIGFARIAELGGDPAWRDAARFFWDTVVTRRTVAFGGNSVREHFNPPDDFSSMVESREGPESCNTYNMLRLTEQLFRHDPAARYADFYERALYNHILSTQHPEHGGFVYFTPIRPRHYRVYSQPEQCFWCCVGSGMENHGKYGRFIYAHNSDGNALFVNLFIASELDWKERRAVVRQETHFPDEPSTRLSLKLARPETFALHVRHPGWVAHGALRVRVNGEDVAVESAPASYAIIRREWRNGDVVEVELPMQTRLEPLPDGSDYAAIVHGPIVLAAKTGTSDLDGLIADDGRMAHVAPGPYRPLDSAPMLVGDPAHIAEAVRPVPGEPLTFTARELIRPESFRDLKLVPFFRVHDARYMLYWQLAAPDEYAGIVAQLEARERERLALERRTVDRVVPGEQQPEVEHAFAGEGTGRGYSFGRSWRAGTGWFSYALKAPEGEPLELMVTTFGRDRDGAYAIWAGDRKLADVTARGDQGERFVDLRFAVPEGSVSRDDAGRIVVKFVAEPESRITPIYDVRIVRTE